MLRGPRPNAVVWLHHTRLHNTEQFGAKSDEQAQERGEGWSLQDSCKKESMSQSLLSLLCHPYKKKEKNGLGPIISNPLACQGSYHTVVIKSQH